MDNIQATTTYNRLMSIYEVQAAYQNATCKRAQTRRNIVRSVRLQDMALQAAGADGDFLTPPLVVMTRRERNFLDVFNSY